MSNKALAAVLTCAVAPVALLFAFGGEDSPASAAALNSKKIPAEYLPWVQKAGQVCPEISSPLIAAQIEQESSWNPQAESHDDQGRPIAQGISQFIPATWATWGQDVASKDGTPQPDGIKDVWTPGDAIIAQAKYDCWLAKKMQGLLKAGAVHGDLVSLTLAAYNAGPDAVEKAGGIPSIPETQGYVKRIQGLMAQYTAVGSSTATGFGARVIAAAEKWKGTPYSWGGGTVDGPSEGFAQGSGIVGFDCSGLVQYAVYQASHGTVMLARTTTEQVKQGSSVTQAELRPGDVIYFALNGSGYDHVGIYVGGGRMIHAPRTGEVISYADITDAYWSGKPQQIRRFG